MTLFQRFVLASGLTNLGDGIATVAWAWLASLLTRDPLLIALVPVALRLPWVLFALPAGIITDRVDRKRLIVSMDIIRAIAFGLAGFAIWQALPLGDAPASGVSNPPLFLGIIFAALFVGAAEVFRDNAAQTMLPSIVPHADLERANGRLWSVELVGNAMLGPAIGAFLIAAYLPLPFVANALIFGGAIALVSRISGDFSPAKRAVRNWKTELKEGFAFLKSNKLLQSLALITGCWNLLFHMMMIALVLHVQENLNLGAQSYGFILAAGAIGGIIGGWAASHIIKILGPGRTAQWMLFASFPAFVAIAVAPSAITLALTLAAFEFTGLVWNTVSVSYRQRIIPNELLGRVNSIYRLVAWGMMPIGLILSGVIVRVSELYWSRDVALISPFIGAAIGALVLAALGWKALRVGFATAVD